MLHIQLQTKRDNVTYTVTNQGDNTTHSHNMTSMGNIKSESKKFNRLIKAIHNEAISRHPKAIIPHCTLNYI